MKFWHKRKQSGQALVALLAFMATAVTLTTAATMVTVANVQSTSRYGLGQEALELAETGADNALLRLQRDPAYAGETLTLANGTATITVSGSSPKTITVVGKSGNFRRTVQVVAAVSGTVLTVTSWDEVP